MPEPESTLERVAELDALRKAIAETVAHRNRLKAEMEAWYGGGHRGRFPGRAELAEVDQRLSDLDTRFKRGYDEAD